MATAAARLPPVHVEEDDKQFTIIADVPGLGKNDIKVTITKDDWLIMSGKRKRGDEIIAFSERFKLPANIDYTGAQSPPCCLLRSIKAKVENGELTVIVPKTPSPVIPEVIEVPIE
ncbi:hypothetical protein WJX81_005361 [Elliptochloris bilobata]|uniref:SHSP domain-containing protein n=1 Tax=Elliptochloris bilobata TaxID=381761 RepID=A0AAW1SKX4_9CHLO